MTTRGDEPTASYGLGIDEMIAGLAADDERVARDPAMRALLDEPRVVIALRERAMRRAVARMLALAGYGTQPVAPEALMMTIAEQVPDAVLLQVSSREVESIERFERLVSAAIPVVIVTSPEDEALATRLHARGARAWLREPFVVEDVLACAARALGEQAVPRTED